jgi:acyl-CoA thioester hydrolase
MRVKVYYADTDAGGVVYHGSYVRWLEVARFEVFEGFGLSVVDFARRGIHFAVVHLEVDYRGLAVLGDELDISTEVTEVRRVRFTLTSEVARCSDNQRMVNARVTMACMDSQGKVLSLPDELAGRLRAAVGHA